MLLNCSPARDARRASRRPGGRSRDGALSDHIISLAITTHPATGSDGRRQQQRSAHVLLGQRRADVRDRRLDGRQRRRNQPGGGGRTNTATIYNNYKTSIDKALELPARATLNVKATGEGDQISVTVNVTAVPADAKDLRLHRPRRKGTPVHGRERHPLPSDGRARDSRRKGRGLAHHATGTTKFTFSLNQIKDEITKSLATEMESATGRSTGFDAARFVAETRGPTPPSTRQLVVVAFLQEGPYRAPKVTPPAPVQRGRPAPRRREARPGQPTASADLALTNILNAAKTDVVFTPAGKTKGGGH